MTFLAAQALTLALIVLMDAYTQQPTRNTL